MHRLLIILVCERSVDTNRRAGLHIFDGKLATSTEAVDVDSRIAAAVAEGDCPVRQHLAARPHDIELGKGGRQAAWRKPRFSLVRKRSLLLQYVEHLLVGFPGMYHYRQLQFICKLNLSSEPMPLHIARRQVVVKVEPDFADCLDLRFAFCNLTESFQHRLVHQLRIVRMHSDDRIAPRIAICVLGCQKARGLVEAHIHHQPNIRGFDFRC